MNNLIHLKNSVVLSERVTIIKVADTQLSYKCTIKNELTDRPNHGLVYGDILRCERLYNASFLCTVDLVNGDEITIPKSSINGKGRPLVGDTLVRFGNLEDTKRQGAISFEQYGSIVSSINVYNKVNENTLFGKEVVKIGFIGGIFDEELGLVEGYGAYLKNAYISGVLYAKEGSNIYTKHEINDLVKGITGENISTGKENFSDISDWRPKRYVGEVSVYYGGTIYFLPLGFVAQAIEQPGISPKWIKKIDILSNLDLSIFNKQQHNNYELLESLKLFNGRYLLTNGIKIWSGNSDEWNGLKQVDYINQPVRSVDNVRFENLNVTNRITSIYIDTNILNAIQEVKTNILNATSTVNTNILNANTEVNTDFLFATTKVKTAWVEATTRVDTDSVYATTKVNTVTVNTTNVRAVHYSSPTFISGFAGTGYRLARDENQNFMLELDRLLVRKDFTVYELIVSQIRATNGSLWVSDAIKVDSVEKVGNNYVCTIDTDEGTIYVPFVVNDIVRCQKFNGKNLKYYTAKVIDANYNDGTFTLTVIEGSNAPEAKDEVVRIGNTTDLTRQGAVYLTASDSGAPYIDVIDRVTSASLANKTTVRMGKLNGIVDPDLGQLSGYGLYTQNGYFKGDVIIKPGGSSNVFNKDEINQKIDEVIDNITPFVTLIGEQVFTYNNDMNMTPDKQSVTLVATEHNFEGDPSNRKWEYDNNGVWTEIPNTFNILTYTLRHDAAIWNGKDAVTIRYKVGELYDQLTIIKIYKGVGELNVVITSDYGDLFINGNIDTILRANVYWGGDNITDTLLDTAFEWFRKSSYGQNDDNIWNYNNKNKKYVHIDSDDVYKKATFECEVTINI